MYQKIKFTPIEISTQNAGCDLKIQFKNEKKSLVYNESDKAIIAAFRKYMKMNTLDNDGKILKTSKTRIISISSNFIDQKEPINNPILYEEKKIVKTSNRGRKKQEKPKKKRKVQGAGTNLNSQTSFRVLSIYEIPKKTNINKNKYKSIEDIGNGYYRVEKPVIIKVFRSGNIQSQGSETHDLVDVQFAVKEICRCFTYVMKQNVIYENLVSNMHNYVFKIKNKHINMRLIQKYFTDYINARIPINFTSLKSYLLNCNELDMKKLHIEINQELNEADITSDVILTTIEKFDKIIENMHLNKIYNEYNEYKKQYESIFSIEILNKIKYQFLVPYLDEIRYRLYHSVDNRIPFANSDFEKYPAYKIKFRSPNKDNLEKVTTVKIFDGGKIEINGAYSIKEAKRIYNYLVKFFNNNQYLLYEPEKDIVDIGWDSD